MADRQSPFGPPPIGAQIRGLLDFFRIKSGGQNPQTLLPAISPVLEVFEWYLVANSLQLQTNSEVLAGVTPNTNFHITSTNPVDVCGLVNAGQLMVPQNEVWYVWDVTTIFSLTNAASSCDAQLFFESLGSVAWGTFPPASLYGYTTGAAGGARAGFRNWNKGRFLPGGARVRHNVAAANDAVTLQTQFKLLRMLA